MLIEDALKQATDAQIKSEWARRTQAMRKTRNGGRRPTPDSMPRYIRKPADVPNIVAASLKTVGHHPRCQCSLCKNAA